MIFFLSYARSDQADVLPFADELKARGISLWVDQYDIRPSEHWDRAVEQALDLADGILVMLSPNSVASTNVADEIAVALDRGKRVIPVMIKLCRPPLRMVRMQYVDATGARQVAIDRCIAALEVSATGTAGTASSAVAPPPKPISEDRTPPELLLAPDDQAEIGRVLALYLGPIAARLIKREQARAGDRDSLLRSLAGAIASESDRAAFLRALEKRA